MKLWLNPNVRLAETLGYSRHELRVIERLARENLEKLRNDLDEDVGVEGLLLGKQSMESETSFAQWLAQRPHSQMVMSAEQIHT